MGDAIKTRIEVEVGQISDVDLEPEMARPSRK